MAVFPYLGSYGYSGKTVAPGILKIYPNLAYRFYKNASVSKKTRVIVFKRYSQTKFDTIQSFFDANQFSAFTVYDPGSGVTSVDPTGASGTGRHTALFYAQDGSPPEFDWSNVGRCLYDISIEVVFLG